MNHQTIDEIIARFGRAGWLVQKTNESYWTVRPKGLYNHKMYLLTYNPFDEKFQLIAPPTPHDPHYQRALKIMQGSDRILQGDRQHSHHSNLPIIKLNTMFPIKIEDRWINLASIMTLRILNTDNGLEVDIVWQSGKETKFTGQIAAILLAEYEKAAELIMQRVETA